MTPRSSCPGGESTPLQGANLRLNYEINNVTDTALGNLARGKPSFCRSDRCLSYRPPGSLLESRGGSILARAEGETAWNEALLGFPCPGEAELVPYLGRWSRSGGKGWGNASHGGVRRYIRWGQGSQNGNPGLRDNYADPRTDPAAKVWQDRRSGLGARAWRPSSGRGERRADRGGNRPSRGGRRRNLLRLLLGVQPRQVGRLAG